jgi:hypothetical protein
MAFDIFAQILPVKYFGNQSSRRERGVHVVDSPLFERKDLGRKIPFTWLISFV